MSSAASARFAAAVGGGQPGREALRAYLRSIAALGRWRIVRVIALIVAGSAVEGFGIVLLIPTLALLFDGRAAGSSPAIRTLYAGLEGVSGELRLWFLLCAFVLLLVLRAAVTWHRDMAVARFSLDLVNGWRDRVVTAIAEAPWRALQRLRHANVEFALTVDVSRLSTGSEQIMRGSVAALQLAIQLALAVYLSPVLSLFLIAAGAAALPLLVPVFRASHRFGTEESVQGRRRHGGLSDFIAGMKLAKAHNAEGHYLREQRELSQAITRRSMRYRRSNALRSTVFQVAAGVVAAAIIGVAVTIAKTPPAVLTGLLVLVSRTVGPAQSLLAGLVGVTTMLPAVTDLQSLEESLRMGRRPTVEPGVAAPPPPPRAPAAISLRGVSYQPLERHGFVLHEVSGELGAGDLGVLFGPSGGGKTTLADILLGLVDPDAGEIRVDGAVLAAADRVAWRDSVGYVPQQTFLFDDTIRANLHWAKADASDEELWRALRMAEADAFVRALPNGLDTTVGNRGSRLSGGEGQRLCLARALIRRPRLLLLDEATNALDTATEARLIATLGRLRGATTILMIAHRLPDGLPIDRVWRLDGGRMSDEAAPAATRPRDPVTRSS